MVSSLILLPLARGPPFTRASSHPKGTPHEGPQGSAHLLIQGPAVLVPSFSPSLGRKAEDTSCPVT